MEALPVATKGNGHDVRCYGLQHGLAASAGDSGGSFGNRGARQICLLRQSLTELGLQRILLGVARQSKDVSDNEARGDA